MVQPNLGYCCNVWGGCYDIHMKTVFTLQKRMIIIMNNESFHAHTGPLFLMDTISKVKDIYRFSLGVNIYKNRGSIDFNRQTTRLYSSRQTVAFTNYYQPLNNQYFLPPHHHGILYLNILKILLRFLSSSVVSKVSFAKATCSLVLVYVFVLLYFDS